MLVGDLIYSDSFDANCNYAIYNCRDGKQWREAPVLFSTLKDGYGKPVDEILDMHVGYITISDNVLIIGRSKERKRKSGIQAFFFCVK